MTKNEILNVLAFWRAVEALSPQQVKTSQAEVLNVNERVEKGD